MSWPHKACVFQALLQQPESVAAPAQNLYAITPSVAKHVERIGKRIERQIVLDQRGQAVDVLPEIDVVTVLNRLGF